MNYNNINTVEDAKNLLAQCIIEAVGNELQKIGRYKQRTVVRFVNADFNLFPDFNLDYYFSREPIIELIIGKVKIFVKESRSNKDFKIILRKVSFIYNEDKKAFDIISFEIN